MNGSTVPQEDQSVLAIPLPEANAILSLVRAQFDGEVPPIGVPAHITIHYPWMPPALINEEVIAELASLFAGFPSLDFSLRLGWFGREVLLLVPEDSTPLIRMTEAVINRWPEYPYYGGEYSEIEPHVSLAYGDECHLSRLAAHIESQIPVKGCASFIGLSIGKPGHMTVRARFPLMPAGTTTIREPSG